MKKNNRSLMRKIAAGVLLLTLASCLLFTTMFAKFTTGDKGDPAGARVATWQVKGVTSGTVDKSFSLQLENLSPSVDSPTRTWNGGDYLIENQSEVAAEISFDIPQLTFYTDTAKTAEYTDENALTYSGNKKITVALLQRVISVKYEAVMTANPTDADWESAIELTKDSKIKLDSKNGDGDKALTVRAIVTWETLAPSTEHLPSGVEVTSTDEGDIIDGLIGLHIQGAKADVKFTATQID